MKRKTKRLTESLLSQRIDEHYETVSRVDPMKGWNRKRIHCLCKLYNMHPYELAAFIRMEDKRMERLLKYPRSAITAQESLIFSLLERFVLEKTLNKKYTTSVFPLHLLNNVI